MSALLSTGNLENARPYSLRAASITDVERLDMRCGLVRIACRNRLARLSGYIAVGSEHVGGRRAKTRWWPGGSLSNEMAALRGRSSLKATPRRAFCRFASGHTSQGRKQIGPRDARIRL